MDLWTATPKIILTVVEKLAGQLAQALDLRHRRQVGSLAAFAGVLHVSLLVALGDIAEAGLKEIPRPQLFEPLIQSPVLALADLDHGAHLRLS